MTGEVQKTHEAFKAQLVDDVFGKDTQGKVPMEKVTMLIWQFRNDQSVVQFMAQFVAKFAGSRDVFDGVEFYLPQLAHMIIHLEANWDDSILERFALIIAQHSMHFALQLNWILQGAIEDYRPEFPNGEPNPAHNPIFYTRCVKLLGNIERCVVYGTPRTHELQRLYEKGKISKNEYELMELADRRFNAAQIAGRRPSVSNTGENPYATDLSAFGGELLYKRQLRTACYKRKPWKTRYFTVTERMLFCYNMRPSLGGTLVRAMPLEGATIAEVKNSKYKFMFEVSNRDYAFRMRANDDPEKNKWMEVLKEESDVSVLYPTELGDSSNHGRHSRHRNGDHHLFLMEDLTPSQRRRYDFFKHQRDFVRDLCNIAEDLRFEERDDRKKLAPGLMEKLEIPRTAYVPLCKSTDIWRRVDTAIAKDTKVFNTKERCPVIMYFISKRGEKMNDHLRGMEDPNLDVAQYLHLQFEVPDPPSTNKITEEGEEDEDEEDEAEGEKDDDDTADYDIKSGDETADNSDEKLTENGAHEAASFWADEDIEGAEHASGGKDGVNMPPKGNSQVKLFLRDNFVKFPQQLASLVSNRSRSFRFHKSELDKAILPLQSVPIIEDKREVNDDDSSIISDAAGSVLTTTGVVTGESDIDGIEKECIERAKALVSGGESWAEKSARMLQEHSERVGINTSEAKVLTEIVPLMAKSNDDLRQEVFVMQMIHYYKSVFANAGLPVWLKTYRILSTSKDTGLIEVLTDATSIDGLKKQEEFPKEGGLRAYFEMVYGPPDSASFLAAQRNFMLSLVGYSIVSYLLGLKDRHNGNIMIDTRGHLIFIDFGFAMGMAPGHEFSFEKAPFKLVLDYVNVMGGINSECFKEFKRLFVACFEAARANSQVALGLVEIMMYKSNYPCFTGSRYGNGVSLKRFENRLMLHVPEKSIRRKALRLVDASLDAFGTNFYDKFQLWSNGYMP